MRREIFEMELRRLRVGMGKPPISPGDVATLFDELSFIPNEAWPDIVTIGLDRWDSWPRNFPKAAKALWYEWQRQRAAEFEEEECSVCYKEGILGFMVDGYRNICACGHCNNWRKHFGENITRWTRGEVIEKGHTMLCCYLHPYCDCDKDIPF